MATPSDIPIVEPAALRPEIDPPAAIAGFVARLRPHLDPVALWLFGSRARQSARPDSDWDLLAVVPDETPDGAIDALTAWTLTRSAGVPVTLLVTRQAELASIWGLPNTIGHDLAREGIKIRIG